MSNVRNVEMNGTINSEKLSPTSAKRLIDSIYDLTYGQYVEVVVGDFTFLALANDVTTEELDNARKTIMAEFAEATGNYDFISSMQLSTKQMKQHLKLMGLLLSSSILSTVYSMETFDYLKDIRIIHKNTPYPSTVSELEGITRKIHAELERTKIDVAETDAQAKKLQQPTTDKPLNRRREFIKLLASVSQFVKYSVTLDTNCAIVAEYVNQMRSYQEHQENRRLLK